MKAQSILETIGNTPHIRINRLFPGSEVWIKSERANPGGSIKDRIALVDGRGRRGDGKLKPGGTIIEPTSGNTGIGLAMVAAVKGYKLVLVMPDSMSVERRRLMLAYGASFDLTPREKGMKGSIAKAQELSPRRPAPGSRSSSTTRPTSTSTCAPRRRRSSADFPEGLDALITGVGTGGHITGCARVLKKAWPGLKVFAVEPTASPVISGGTALRRTRSRASAPASSRQTSTPRCSTASSRSRPTARKEMARRCAREEGMLVGMSSGATLAAIAQKLPELPPGARVLGFNYDTGERYLSVAGLPAGVIAAGRGA